MSASFERQIKFIRGETPTFRYQFKLGSGQTLDLTDGTLTLNVKEKLADDTVLFTKTLTVTDATAGKAQVKLSQSETDRVGDFFSEVKISFDGGATVRKPKDSQIMLVIGPTVDL